MPVEGYQRHDLFAHGFELRRAAKLGKIDDEGAEDDVRPGALKEADRRPRRAARRNQIIDEKHAVALAHGVDMDLDLVDPVFEFIALADRLVGELPLFADRHEADGELMCDRPAKNKAARLDARDLVDLLAGERLHKLVDGATKRARVS